MNAASKDTNSNTPGLQKNVAESLQVTSPKHRIAADSQAKPPLPETKAQFGQATFYRQGVLVPGGPHKSPTPQQEPVAARRLPSMREAPVRVSRFSRTQ